MKGNIVKIKPFYIVLESYMLMVSAERKNEQGLLLSPD